MLAERPDRPTIVEAHTLPVGYLNREVVGVDAGRL